ncbi:Serine--tRNA ligase, chloroplast or mitochondrial [Oopsacas minuta]|uniref:serine--tRNA ligase n=1 Tax=Oopsacas minuta TaxID=111878 RepID=A0AAV7JSU2_9METZ|nr:Serine--tRNA ligase, chloroplast or mitochondrial [Oopsacas minuta]
MSYSQILTFGLKIFQGTTFNEVNLQLEPLWTNFAKRKHYIPYSTRTVAKMLVHDKYTQTLLNRLEFSHKWFTTQISSLILEKKHQNSNAKLNSDLQLLLNRSKALKDTISLLKKEEKMRFQTLQQLFESFPNILHQSVPDKIQVIKTTPKITRFGSECRDHVQLGIELDLFDLQTASNVSGHRFVYLKGDCALLAHALESWTIDLLADHGFLLISTPDVIKNDILAGCGFKPDGPSSQIYGVSHGKNHGISLAGTAEIPLVGYYANKNLMADLNKSDIRVCAASNCYRAEAGDRGKKIRGLYRLHQFRKIEMVCITQPDKDRSNSVFKQLVNIQESIYKMLRLPYRVIHIPADDLGDVASRKIDIEVYMPGMGMYGEVTSASECLGYQSSRLNIMCDSKYAYTLNATAVAIPRTLIGIIENYQRPNGIGIPAVLQSYMRQMTHIPIRTKKWNNGNKSISTHYLQNSIGGFSHFKADTSKLLRIV